MNSNVKSLIDRRKMKAFAKIFCESRVQSNQIFSDPSQHGPVTVCYACILFHFDCSLYLYVSFWQMFFFCFVWGIIYSLHYS